MKLVEFRKIGEYRETIEPCTEEDVGVHLEAVALPETSSKRYMAISYRLLHERELHRLQTEGRVVLDVDSWPHTPSFDRYFLRKTMAVCLQAGLHITAAATASLGAQD